MSFLEKTNFIIGANNIFWNEKYYILNMYKQFQGKQANIDLVVGIWMLRVKTYLKHHVQRSMILVCPISLSYRMLTNNINSYQMICIWNIFTCQQSIVKILINFQISKCTLYGLCQCVHIPKYKAKSSHVQPLPMFIH